MLAVLYGAAFVAAFNENIVNVALVDIIAAFSVDPGLAQWLVTGYMIVTAIVVACMAYLSRRFTLRTLFFIGSAFLVAGSAACLVAPTFPLLLAFRLLQAVGTGIFIPLMMTSVLAVAPKQRLGTYLSIGSCCITLGPAFAPVVSGLMVTYLGWRSVFLLPTVAIAVIAIVGIFAVKNILETKRAALDAPSVALAAIGLTAFVYGLSSFTSDIVVGFAGLIVGVAIIAAFALRQKKLDDPLIDLSPLANPRFALACPLVIVAMMTTFSMSVLLPLYYQGSLEASALVAGLLILVPVLVNSATAIFGGRIMDRIGAWPLLPIGFGIIAIGQIGIAFVSMEAALVPVLAGSVLVYAGVGLIFSPSQTAGLASLDRSQNGNGVTIMNLFIQIAACVGPALFVGIFSTRVGAETQAGTAPALAQAAGFSSAVFAAAVCAVIGFLVSVYYARKGALESSEGNQTAPAPAQNASILSLIGKTDAYRVSSSATVLEAVDTLVKTQTGGIPVVDPRDEVVGFITDGDIMRYLAGGERKAMDPLYAYMSIAERGELAQRVPELLSTNVMELATKKVICIEEDASVENVCLALSDPRIKKLPVVADGKLAGTISRSDLVRYLLSEFAELPKRVAFDDACAMRAQASRSNREKAVSLSETA